MMVVIESMDITFMPFL